MSSDLRNKVVLITGASTGIGAAAALAFAGAGSKVMVHYNASRDAAESVVARVREAGGIADAVHGDVTRGADIKRIVAETVERHGRIDVLVNNAGGMVGPHAHRGLHRAVHPAGGRAQRDAGRDVHA